MSRMDDLIRQYCPVGVDTRPIGEIAELVRGNGMPKSDFVDEGVGCIHYGQIYTFYGTWAKETRSFVAPATAAKLAQVDPGDVIITNTSENLDDVCKAVAWLGDSTIVTGGHATVLKHDQDPKFLSYFFQTQQFHADKKRLATGTKVIDVSAKSLAKISIPVPPLEVQREIVRVLDLFQSLEAELEAELEARKKQYEVFQELRFNFANEMGVKWAQMGQVCSTFSGTFVKKTEQEDHYEYPVFNGGSSPTGFYSDYNSPENSIAISARGSIGAVNWVTTKFWAGNSCHVVLATDPGLNNRFLYHYLKFHEPSLYALRAVGTIPALNLKPLLKFTIPMPSLELQARISAELDKYESLMYGTSGGLSAELTARRSQYEYYRHRLLTFEEAA